jgi:hypothetical protein
MRSPLIKPKLIRAWHGCATADWLARREAKGMMPFRRPGESPDVLAKSLVKGRVTKLSAIEFTSCHRARREFPTECLRGEHLTDPPASPARHFVKVDPSPFAPALSRRH